MAYTEEYIAQVEIVCKDCRQGRHGCAGIWKGLGLEIFCCCSCTASRGIAAARNERIGES